MLEGLFQPMHLLVIFAIALLVFRPKNFPNWEGNWRGHSRSERWNERALRGTDNYRKYGCQEHDA